MSTPQEGETIDTEDLGTLAEMVSLGTHYIEEQDEQDDKKNVPVMEEALKLITGLIPGEMGENEGNEPEDESA